MGFLSEFKEFAVKGNAIDMAVGIIIGAAFGGVVQSIVNDVVMPPIGQLTGGIDFADQAISLESWEMIDPTLEANADVPALKYGAFINTLINFFIVATAVFVLVKGMNSLRRKDADPEQPSPAPPTKQEVLLAEIRDAIKSKGNV